MGVESEEDLHSDPLFRLPFFDALSCIITLPFIETFYCHIRGAFKEHQRYITPHETKIHDAFAELTVGCRIMVGGLDSIAGRQIPRDRGLVTSIQVCRLAW